VTADTEQLQRMRAAYQQAGLSRRTLAKDWHSQFILWLDDAIAAGLPEPNAMVLATATPDGRVSARTVLLKGVDVRGLVFYTNHTSRKATEIEANSSVSLVFPWFPIGRQVVVCGEASVAEREVTDGYFATRPRESQLAAWASPQSAVVADRSVLDRALAEADQRFPDDVPAPSHWGGYRVAPRSVEFWQGRAGRLHDRLRYRCGDDGWVVERLAP